MTDCVRDARYQEGQCPLQPVAVKAAVAFWCCESLSCLWIPTRQELRAALSEAQKSQTAAETRLAAALEESQAVAERERSAKEEVSTREREAKSAAAQAAQLQAELREVQRLLAASEKELETRGNTQGSVGAANAGPKAHLPVRVNRECAMPVRSGVTR